MQVRASPVLAKMSLVKASLLLFCVCVYAVSCRPVDDQLSGATELQKCGLEVLDLVQKLTGAVKDGGPSLTTLNACLGPHTQDIKDAGKMVAEKWATDARKLEGCQKYVKYVKPCTDQV